MSMPSKLYHNPTLHAPVTDHLHIATKAYVDSMAAANDAMQFMGVIDASANPNYPAAVNAGETYKVSVAGRIGGASGPQVEVGDMLISTSATEGGDHASVGNAWAILQTNMVQATTEGVGFVELATKTEAEARTDTVRAVTPASLADFALKSEASPGVGVKFYSGPPQNNVSPDFSGQVLIDTQNKQVYVSHGVSAGDWCGVTNDYGGNAIVTATNQYQYNPLQIDLLQWSPTSGACILTLSPHTNSMSYGAHSFSVIFTVPSSGNGIDLRPRDANNVVCSLSWLGDAAPEWAIDPDYAFSDSPDKGKTFLLKFWLIRDGGGVRYLASWQGMVAAPEVLSGSGAPYGEVTSASIGQSYIDDSNFMQYVSPEAGDNQYWLGIQNSTLWNSVVGAFTQPLTDMLSGAYTLRSANSTETFSLSNDLPSDFAANMSVYIDTGAANTQWTISIPDLTVVWANDAPAPFVSGETSANEMYRLDISVNVAEGKAVLAWVAIGHSNGVLSLDSLAGYQKTVYRAVSEESSGTILGSATGIENKYAQVSAYEAGTPNVPVAIAYTIAANGDISWTSSQEFTGYIVISGAVTPASV